MPVAITAAHHSTIVRACLHSAHVCSEATVAYSRDRADQAPRRWPSGRCDGDHPKRTAATVDDLQRRGNHDRPRWRQLIEIAQAGEAELAGTVHRRVVRKGRIKSAR